MEYKPSFTVFMFPGTITETQKEKDNLNLDDVVRKSYSVDFAKKSAEIAPVKPQYQNYFYIKSNLTDIGFISF